MSSDPVDQPFVGVVTGTVAVDAGDTLNVRAAAEPDAAVLTELPPGAEITVQGEEMNAGTKWLLINAGNKSGWVNASYVKITDAECK